ncbi:uncharacterized protein LOC117181048 [Belonocnema kinseyi]|uniref:uncharacterized protein LOC117181048 n=1 Tax=Belonocnema kinseyi TaxID=2817044 RepID=UPI00143D254D|nr:uncharacterized protein LOC117181048 [Belonocnema kinseyi]
MHGRIQLSSYTLRQAFWIIGGRTLVKSLIRRCVSCVRERAVTDQQLMGSLLDFKTTCRPFTHTGVDYADPFSVRFAPGRGQKRYKGYVALFICCVTHAIHLEFVSDIYSDNGTTFQGADCELRHNVSQIRRDVDLMDLFSVEGTTWHFIPSAAPNFGGLWEAGVKSLKHHFQRCVGSHTLTFEEFTTSLARIGSCLNSRLIGPLLDDPDDFSYLTPGHFLIGAPMTGAPEPSVELVPENRLTRWQIVQRIAEMFWRRWNVEYLHSLQHRYKWNQELPNIKVGDMVLIKHDALPPSKWTLGRIIISSPVSNSSPMRPCRGRTPPSVEPSPERLFSSARRSAERPSSPARRSIERPSSSDSPLILARHAVQNDQTRRAPDNGSKSSADHPRVQGTENDLDGNTTTIRLTAHVK